MLKIANSILSGVATITSVSIMAFSGYMIYENAYVSNRAFGAESLNYKPDVQEETVSIEALLANIPDAIGWITIDGTHIDYPIVKGPDDVYYASRDVNKDPSLTGAIYMQAKNQGDFSETYSLLYGHHMDNGAMFGDLSKYEETGFFDSHLTGTLVTLEDVYEIEVISLVETDAYEQAIYGITSLDWEGYNGTILNNGNIELINRNSAVTSADKFLVLSTCEGVATDGRLLLICRLTDTDKAVRPTPEPTPAPSEDGTPTPTPAGGTGKLVKTGDSGDGAGWALLNLCCLILTITMLLPYFFEKLEKRSKDDEEENQEEKVTTFKNYVGPVANVILAIAAVVIFVLYENMKLPMILKDRYTPWMLIILGIALATEEICSRLKKKENELGEEVADV
ncbi:MAG: class B sortase [Clostridiales bacterium]|nr:class B sortase [Clostridiales bacterium]